MMVLTCTGVHFTPRESETAKNVLVHVPGRYSNLQVTWLNVSHDVWCAAVIAVQAEKISWLHHLTTK